MKRKSLVYHIAFGCRILSCWWSHQNKWNCHHDLDKIFETSLSPWNPKILSKILIKHINRLIANGQDFQTSWDDSFLRNIQNLGDTFSQISWWWSGYKTHPFCTNSFGIYILFVLWLFVKKKKGSGCKT